MRLRGASLRPAPEAGSDDPPNRRRPIKARVLTSAFSSAVVAAILGAASHTRIDRASTIPGTAIGVVDIAVNTTPY